METQIKPVKTAFILSRIAKPVFFMAIIAIALHTLIKALFPETSPGMPIAVFLILAALVDYWWESIIYRKTGFIFQDDRIVQKGGSLFSSYETELMVKNITHLEMRLPFLENKLFGTGHIRIESAGSDFSEIYLWSIADHEKIYGLAMDMMGANGFAMDKGERLMVEQPNGLGVFFEVFKSFLAGLFIFFYIISDVQYDDNGKRIDFMYDLITGNFIMIATVGVSVALFYHFLKFLDLKKRVYEIFQNAIVFSEGFLSKNYSFLPFQNLTDSKVTQTMVDRIFGLYDVVLSCQGSARETHFKNIKNGQAMSDQLDALIANKTAAPARSATQSASLASEKSATSPDNRRESAERLEYDTDYAAEFRMDLRKSFYLPLIAAVLLVILAGICFFVLWHSRDSKSLPGYLTVGLSLGMIFVSLILMLISIVSAIVGYINVRSNKYFIKSQSVSQEYKFINASQAEFTADKITGTVLSRSFIDYWLGTATIRFWSIGAGSTLVFSNIKLGKGIVENILSKFGVRREDTVLELRPDFRISEYLKSILPWFALGCFVLFGGAFALAMVSAWAAVAICAITAAIFGLIFFFKNESQKRTCLIFCRNLLFYQTGWLFKKFYYVKYSDIKNIKTTRYPFSGQGDIKFDVAGESVSVSRNGKTVTDYNFTAGYIPDIQAMDDLIDYILCRQPDSQGLAAALDDIRTLSKPRTATKPSYKNSLFPWLFVIVLIDTILALFFLVSQVNAKLAILAIAILVDAIILVPIILSVKMTTYIMDDYRILTKNGVIYKYQTSVIYDKIDFIQKNQGFLNKMFKNGNIAVSTIGSSLTELRLKDVPDYEKLYDALKAEYEK